MPVTRRRRSKKPSAASVLEGMAGGRTDPAIKIAKKPPPKPKSAETEFGKLAARNASIVVSPDLMNEFADQVCREDRGVYELTDFALPGFDDAAQIVCHPTFVRAAAKRGKVFYVDAAKKVRAATIQGVEPDSAPLASKPDDEGVYFKRQPWHVALEKFVERGVPVLLIGPAGCISGDTHVAYVVRDKTTGKLVNKKGGPLERLYRRFNGLPQIGGGPRWATDVEFFVQSVTDEGVIRLNQINQVVYSGEKQVFRVTTLSGKSLKATADHEFLVGDYYRPLSLLSPGDRVCVNPGKPQSAGGRRNPVYRKEIFVKYHPSATTKVVNGCTYYRLYEHRAVYEAHLNGLALGDYRALLNSGDTDTINALKFIPPDHDVHHVDEDMSNNEITNLRLMRHDDHARQHGGDGPEIFVEHDTIVEITPLGVERVYDIACGDPYRNFVAGGVVVHNCGKSHSTELLFEAREQNLEIVSCRPDMEAQDLNGSVEVVAEDGVSVTKYVPSPAARAAEHGYGLLLDEMDALRPEAAFSLYRVIDGKSMFIPSGEIELHPDFRVVATQNTEGRGDDKGVFHGRAYQDDAFLDRWEATIRVDYPSPGDEVEILMNRTGIDRPAADSIINCAGLLRRAYEEHNVMRCCTMRRTLAVATNLAAGFKNHDAWLYGMLNQVTPSDAAKIKDILIRIYGSKINKKKLGA